MDNDVQNENTFENQLQELSSIVDELGKGDLPLNEALTKFQKGMTLSHQLKATLNQAHDKVAKIIDDDNNLSNLD